MSLRDHVGRHARQCHADRFRYAWTWSLILSDISDDDAGEYTCRVSSTTDDQTLTIIKRFNLTVLSKHLDLTAICDSTPRWESARTWKWGASDRYLIRQIITPTGYFNTFDICPSIVSTTRPKWMSSRGLLCTYSLLVELPEQTFGRMPTSHIWLLIDVWPPQLVSLDKARDMPSLLAPPKIIDIIVESGNNGILRENDQITLTCSTRGVPQPKISWHVSGRKVLSGKRNDRSEHLWTLERRTVSYGHSSFIVLQIFSSARVN